MLKLLLSNADRNPTVPAFGLLTVPVGFAPTNLRVATAEVTLTASSSCLDATSCDGTPLVWRFPLRALAEVHQSAGSVFKYKCKVRVHGSQI